MTSLKEFSEGRTDQYKIDPRKLQIKAGWNSRDFTDPDNIAHVEEIARSVAEIGVKRALVVNMEGDIPYLVDGECRLRGVMLAISRGADIKTVPVVGEDRFSNEADRLFNQDIYNSGKQFSLLEKARHYKRIIDMGWNQCDIAKKAGISNGRVSQLLELLTLQPSVQKYIVAGKISATMALQVFKRLNGDEAATIAEIEAALVKASAEGRTRAMPKDREAFEGDGEPKAKKEPNAKKASGSEGALVAHLKALIEKAYVDGRIDDSENMVTWSVEEKDWAELMEMINY